MPFTKTPEAEQLRRALPLLLATRRAVVVSGARDVIDELQQAGRGGIESHWARQALLRFVSAVSLQSWQSDLNVRQSDLTRALDRAIRLCRRVDGRHGSWNVARA